MRILYYVPMIHTDKELDETGLTVRDLKQKIYGQEAVIRDENTIERLWENIKLWVFQTIKDIAGLVIYQDGMPAGPREKIRQLFDLVLAEHPQSPLFRLTQKLIDRGAVLEGTEDINLVVKRANIYKEIYQTAAKCQNLQDIREFVVKKIEEQDGLIIQSDQFIAKRINETLPENGKGILFIGYRHKVDEELIKMSKSDLLSTSIEIRKLNLRIEKANI